MSISELNASARRLYEYLKKKSVKNEIQISIQEVIDSLPRVDNGTYSAQGVAYLLGRLRENGAISVKIKGLKNNPTVYTINRSLK